jgi:hypothetical protein
MKKRKSDKQIRREVEKAIPGLISMFESLGWNETPTKDIKPTSWLQGKL